MTDGIVLDETTAKLVPVGSTIVSPGRVAEFASVGRPACRGDILVAIAGRPIAELVAERDRALLDAVYLREVAVFVDPFRWPTAASRIDEVADRTEHRADQSIHPALVSAYRAQQRQTPEGDATDEF